MHKLDESYRDSFSDMTELLQATQFLHENGILLHYNDVNLQDVYFLDPQWLCDVLANVVTIREINSLAKSGQCVLFKCIYTFSNSTAKHYELFMVLTYISSTSKQ